MRVASVFQNNLKVKLPEIVKWLKIFVLNGSIVEENNRRQLDIQQYMELFLLLLLFTLGL